MFTQRDDINYCWWKLLPIIHILLVWLSKECLQNIVPTDGYAVGFNLLRNFTFKTTSINPKMHLICLSFNVKPKLFYSLGFLFWLSWVYTWKANNAIFLKLYVFGSRLFPFLLFIYILLLVILDLVFYPNLGMLWGVILKQD